MHHQSASARLYYLHMKMAVVWRYLLNGKYRHFKISRSYIQAVQSHPKWKCLLTSWHGFIVLRETSFPEWVSKSKEEKIEMKWKKKELEFTCSRCNNSSGHYIPHEKNDVRMKAAATMRNSSGYHRHVTLNIIHGFYYHIIALGGWFAIVFVGHSLTLFTVYIYNACLFILCALLYRFAVQ